MAIKIMVLFLALLLLIGTGAKILKHFFDKD
jgi:hypothetical protein